MVRKHILDTHTLIWYLESNPRIGRAAKIVMDNPTSELVLPIIAIAEAVDIVNKKRTAISSVSDLLDDVSRDTRIEIQSLNLEILRQSLSINNVPEMYDRLIVATALFLQSIGYQVDILTKDDSITKAALVPVIWQRNARLNFNFTDENILRYNPDLLRQ
jgi:PIN domain nuclease of toxin-antitoxin system